MPGNTLAFPGVYKAGAVIAKETWTIIEENSPGIFLCNAKYYPIQFLQTL
jgi:hypothetical protein